MRILVLVLALISSGLRLLAQQGTNLLTAIDLGVLSTSEIVRPDSIGGFGSQKWYKFQINNAHLRVIGSISGLPGRLEVNLFEDRNNDGVGERLGSRILDVAGIQFSDSLDDGVY